MSTVTHHGATRWVNDWDNVTRLGAALVDELCFTGEQLQRYYEKPWKWTEEWNRLHAGLPLDPNEEENDDAIP